MSFNKKNNVVAGEINSEDLRHIREAVCIQVEKVYDHCQEKDCIEDARVLFKNCPKTRWIINNAINVKARKAEVVNVYSDIEPVPFKRGFFTIDIKYFIKVTLDFFVPVGDNPVRTRIFTRTGFVVFDKKVILFGSEGKVKIFKSQFVFDDQDKTMRSKLEQNNLPISKIEVAEPIALNAQLQDILDKCFEDSCCVDQIPREIADFIDDDDRGFTDDLEAEVAGTEDRIPRRRVVATIGLFSIIKLVRNVQLLIPAFDFCVPNKQCIAATDENPCELFDTIDFPFDEFFPPQIFDFPGAVEAQQEMMDCVKGREAQA